MYSVLFKDEIVLNKAHFDEAINEIVNIMSCHKILLPPFSNASRQKTSKKDNIIIM